jgi:hypothetical protein
MIFMGVMLAKWLNKGQEYLKYMFNVHLAASRCCLFGFEGFPPFEVCKKGLVVAL